MLEIISEFLNSDGLHDVLRHPQFIAFIIAIALVVFRRIIMPKARVIWGVSHGFNFLIPQNPETERAQAIANLPVNTRSLYVKNNGRAVAKNVEFYFNYRPEHYELWPVIQHSIENTPDGRFIVRIPFIGKKEFFRIELIHSKDNPPGIVNVRAEEGECREVSMAPVQIFSNLINYLVVVLMFFGIVQLMLILIYIIQTFLN